MSFRKRNVALGPGSRGGGDASGEKTSSAQATGLRPSVIDGRPVTSTGVASLDGLLAGHGGLVMGHSLLIEESGTTDYAGAILRFFAAEGLMQDHHVHVLALPDQWGRELPGLASESKNKTTSEAQTDKMKIAWRYERLGQFGAESSSRDQPLAPSATPTNTSSVPVFCHTFDLSKRLAHPPNSQIRFYPVTPNPSISPFTHFLTTLKNHISKSPSTTVHRIIIPSLLSPARYPPHSVLPQHLLGLQHALHALLATHSNRLVLLQTLPLSLHSRSTGLTTLVETISSGVLELTPFPHSAEAEFTAARDPTTKEEPPQGLLTVQKLPLLTETASGRDGERVWTFAVSRRRIKLEVWRLPPVDGDTEAQQQANTAETGQAKKKDLEF